jgi:Spy/CpxP family protein refolding chaperone
MDIFTQKKLLMRIVILVTALNILLIGALLWKDFFHRPPRPENQYNLPEVSSILQRELNLSENQVQQIKNIRNDFFRKEKEVEETIRFERDSINATMFNQNTDEKHIKSLARRVADNEYKMELLRFDQALELKTICTPEQLRKFEGLIKEIRDFFRQDDKPKRK